MLKMVMTKLTDLMPESGQCNNRFRNGSITNICLQKGLNTSPFAKFSTSSCDIDGYLWPEKNCVLGNVASIDGQLCPLNLPIMDSHSCSGSDISGKHRQFSVNGVHVSNPLQTLRYRKQTSSGKTQNKKEISTKLSQSCGVEMQRLPSSTKRCNGNNLLSRCGCGFKQKLIKWMPCWLSEPEYMVEPQPREKSDFLIHSHADSLFSTSSGFTNYYGILNLCLILLVLGNARLFLENIIKYGILINLSFMKWFFLDPYNWPNLLLTLSIAIHVLITLATEKVLAKAWISNKTGAVIYVINLSVLLFLPAGVIYVLHPVIVFSNLTLGMVTVSFLKLISYGHVNFWCRQRLTGDKLKQRISGGSGQSSDKTSSTAKTPAADNSLPGGPVVASSEIKQTYPDNVNIRDLTYFLFAPTLCYELNFPRTARIRKRFLAKRLLEMVFLSWLLVALMQQWIVPVMNNARQPLAEMEYFKMLERLLKLSIPNHFIWLVFFYWFFHSCLNVFAELLRFGDREFYRDWWNAETVSEFWQNWNIPVHRFCARHLYKPLLRRGVPKLLASTTVFMFSAFFHEYLVSVPLRMFKVWAFFGMLMQVPNAYITGRYVRGKWGNIIMWLSLILGQPIAILAYFHDYYVVHSLPLSPGNVTES